MRLFLSYTKSINYALWAAFTAVFFVICLFTAVFTLRTTNSPSNITKRVERVLNEKNLQVKKILKNSPPDKLSQLEKNGIIFQYYINDSLVYWSDNSVSELTRDQLRKTEGIQKLPNGWYQIIVLKNGNTKAVGLILIKSQYSFENEYLENSFQKDFSVPEKIDISVGQIPETICTISGTPLFSLNFSEYTVSFDTYTWLLTLLLFFAFFLLCYSIYFFYSSAVWLVDKPWLFVVLFIADVILLRILQGYFQFPKALYSTAFFSPLYYSSSGFLPSAGDYLFNSLIILVLANVLFLKLRKTRPKDGGEVKSGKFKALLAILIIVSAYLFLCHGLDDLVKNSSFSLDLKDISKIGVQSIIGILIAYSLALAFYFISRTAWTFLVHFSRNKKGIVIIGSTLCVFLFDLLFWDIRISGVMAALFGILLLSLLFIHGENSKISPLANSILPMIWMSLLVAVVFNNTGYYKEREERKLIAIKLATGKNPITELLYNKLEHKLLNDSTIFSMINNSDTIREDALIQKIKSEYINDSWNRFTVQITVCVPGKMLKIQPKGYVFDCEQYFGQLIEKVGEKTLNPGLFYLDYGNGIETYLAALTLNNVKTAEKNRQVKIYIEFNAKTPAKDLGYPELLIDRRIMNLPDLGNYSYALYQSGLLVYKTGKFNYDMSIDDYMPSTVRNAFYSSEGIDHYSYRMDKFRVLVISKKENSFLEILSPASYLFIIFSFLTLFLNLIFRPSMLPGFSFLTLKSRFQLANVGIIVVSFLILGCLLLYSLIRLNNLKNMDSFSERTLSVMTEMQEKYGDKPNLAKLENGILEENLQQISGMFYTDVNLYSPSGTLIVSSRPQVFDEGLISGRMNYEALMDLKTNRQSIFFRDEQIGSYKYTSAYFPLLNYKNEILSYINLPFFSRQEDLKKEINDFLVAFMNLYILFILLSVFFSIAISRYLSAPLGLLVSRMEGFKLGKRNEKIIWHHHDEIGRLVEEYNSLIDELAFSADQLAKSERESAWREMARQVAHEIKNPLTPMKLSVQHLRKTWDDKSDDFNIRLQHFTRIMTEQIDSLAAIATEFSDFAKMPLPISEELDLIEILNSVMSMYNGLENIQISLETNEKSAFIIGDRKQLARVFTNLLNNAIQAISATEKGRIRIGIQLKKNQYIIEIEDNGNGIPDELFDRIFQPNFTTKSGGAGLGLAIVRGIIRNMEGDVNFVSAKNKTVFTVIIPIHYEILSG